MNLKTRYDVVILGAGHNGLVAAAYLGGAGLSVLLLEKNDYIGGATTSKRVFPDYDAHLSRYAYLVSLLPDKIVRDLGLNLELRSRAIASFTPYLRSGTHQGLLLSNVSDETSRESIRQLTGSDAEFEQLRKFYALGRIFAEEVWDTMLEPLRGREEWTRRFASDDQRREAWRSLVEEPLGNAVERYLQDDLLRGVVFTDAKIGLLTHPHDDSLLQNRCFLYHVIGNRTGEWKVPVGGMGRVAAELERAAAAGGAEMLTNIQLKQLDLSEASRSVQFELGGKSHTVEARFLLVNFGANVLAGLTGKTYQPDATHEGSVLKINMLLHRLPRLRAAGVSPEDALRGTFHIDEGYDEMKTSHRQAIDHQLPQKIPCEMYCHTLTDNSILSPDLQARGFHTLTLFTLDTPWRLFAKNNETMRQQAARRCLEGLNAWLAEPIDGCLARTKDGESCLETKSPVDIEQELGHYRGNIFHGALTFPFAENEEMIGSWGVETEFKNVFLCGASARRGGGVSGIPGHNAAMKVLQSVAGPAAERSDSPKAPAGFPLDGRRPDGSVSIMSSETIAAPPAPKKINLRRPDIMEAVQAQVQSHYRSELVNRIRHLGLVRSGNGILTIKLAKEFGFCYGVERAVDLAYAARKVFPNQPIYILGEIIHNPEVNDQIRAMDIRFLSGKEKNANIEELGAGDVVIIPAFGTEVVTRLKLEAKGCVFVDTTCGDVMSVWKRVRQYSKEAVTSIIHGKAWHEETKATSSQATATSGHYLVVFTLQETDFVCDYIMRGGDKLEFLEKFKGACSPGFDPDIHLGAVGVANQTTMLRGETEEVQRRLKAAMAARYGIENVDKHFRFFDTICGATQDRQDALEKLLREPLHLLLVIGGYNSSNTSHLAEMGEAKLPTYFIKNAAKIVSDRVIQHFDLHKQEEVESRDWLPAGNITVGITAGASCPNNLIEDVIRRLFELKGVSVQELLSNN